MPNSLWIALRQSIPFTRGMVRSSGTWSRAPAPAGVEPFETASGFRDTQAAFGSLRRATGRTTSLAMDDQAGLIGARRAHADSASRRSMSSTTIRRSGRRNTPLLNWRQVADRFGGVSSIMSMRRLSTSWT